MDWIEQKYIGIVSSRLEKFKRKGPNLYNFRCILCGDSETSKSKARGYIYEKQGKSRFHCHNCGATMTVANFIKTVDQSVYNEMVLEKLKNNKSPEQKEFDSFVEKMKKPVFLKAGPLSKLKKVSQLSPNHPVKVLVDKRKIPTPYHAKLFACPNFFQFTNELLPGKFEENVLKHDETRLLIPFLTKDKKLHAYQGRSLNSNSKAKYITIVLDETVPKLYGLDTVNFEKKYYVFEGPIDSMFVENSIAAAGGDLYSVIPQAHKKNAVLVFDNEPRKKETVAKLDKAIHQGYSVCIWPENLEHKDINDMILAGLSSDFIKYIIDQNTHRDLAAIFTLKKWSKV